MIRALTFAAFIALLSSCSKKPGTGAEPTEEASVSGQIVHLWMGDDGKLYAGFEGDGSMKSFFRNRSGDEFEFVAHRLPPNEGYEWGGLNDDPKFHIVEISGRMDLDEADGISISGKIECTDPTTVRFTWMVEKGGDPNNEVPEKDYSVGSSDLAFEGMVVGWEEQ